MLTMFFSVLTSLPYIRAQTLCIEFVLRSSHQTDIACETGVTESSVVYLDSARIFPQDLLPGVSFQMQSNTSTCERMEFNMWTKLCRML